MLSIQQKLTDMGLIKAGNSRYLRFYLSYLVTHFDVAFSVESQDKEELQLKVYRALITHLDSQQKELRVNELNKCVLEHLLPNNSFDWIDKNEDRIVYFVWSMLRLMTTTKMNIDDNQHDLNYTFRLSECLEFMNKGQRNLYQRVGVNKLPLHRSEALIAIYDFFDQWKANAAAKERLMNILKEKWLYIAAEIRPDYSWLESRNKQQNIWLNHYIKSKLEYLPHMPPPVSATQYHNVNIALIDTLFTLKKGVIRNPIEESKKEKATTINKPYQEYLTCHEVLHNMMKAWKQKLYRKNHSKHSSKS
ncbi:hypothetical protein DLI08_19385 [Vibrio parahaemolyticus]|nr:hypothetical protein [Vibrio parahaemolyticus]EGX6075723.1 hypothetical protein [Vibrio parahaemolyticus]